LKSLKNPYKENIKFKNPAFGLYKKNSKLKFNTSLRNAKKKASKRRENNIIDLSMNQHENNSIDSYSEFNLTTEGSFPPLEKTSPKGAIIVEEDKRIARSLERGTDYNNKPSNSQISSKMTFNKRASGSINNSISISENAISLQGASKANMRSGIFQQK